MNGLLGGMRLPRYVLVTVKRYVKLYREGGTAAFFAPPQKRSASKLRPQVCQEVQALLDPS